MLAPPLPERNLAHPPGVFLHPPPVAAVRSRRRRLPQHAAAACRSGSQHGVARLNAAWTGALGWVTVERQGFTGGEGLGAARWEKPGGGLALCFFLQARSV